MDKVASSKNHHKRHCLYCGNKADIVWVHGHGQCAACGINVEECCQGEQCENTPPHKKSHLAEGE